MDVGQNSSLGDGDSGQQFVQLLVVADGELEMSGDDPGLLVVSSCVSSQLQDFSGEILHHGAEVDRGACANQLGVVALAKKSVDTTDRELNSGPTGSGFGLGPGLLSTFATSGHVGSFLVDWSLRNGYKVLMLCPIYTWFRLSVGQMLLIGAEVGSEPCDWLRCLYAALLHLG